MEIEPTANLPLIYQLTDPFDNATYYVQAVIYDSGSLRVLSTKNLSSQGGGLYSSTFYAPDDLSGSGRHIHVIISVYTDSNHTTYSDKYAKQIDKYLIKKTATSFGAGGADSDYTRIKKMIDDASAKNRSEIMDDMKKCMDGSMPKLDLSPVHDHLEEISDSISAIKIPDQKETDLTPIITSMERIGRAIAGIVQGIKIPEQKDVDLAPIITSLKAIEDQVNSISSFDSTNSLLLEQKKELVAVIEKTIKDLMAEQNAKNSKIREALALAAGADMPTPPQQKPVEAMPENMKTYFGEMPPQKT